MDCLCNSLDFVAAGIDDRLHDGWGHSYPAGHRHRCDAGPGHSGAKTNINILTLAGEGEVLTERSTRYKRENYLYPPAYALMLIGTFVSLCIDIHTGKHM